MQVMRRVDARSDATTIKLGLDAVRRSPQAVMVDRVDQGWKCLEAHGAPWKHELDVA